MLMVDRRLMWLAGVLLGGGRAASAQTSGPQAPPVTAPAPRAPDATGPTTEPARSAPPAAPPSTTAMPATPDAALAQRAREAKENGKLIDVRSAAEVEGCRDLGSDAESSDLEGLRGRARIRVALRRIARARGASHMLFFGYRAGAVQTEHGRYFDCAGDLAMAPPPGLTATAVTAPPPEIAAPPRAPVRVGAASAQVDLLPAGSLHRKLQGDSLTSAAATTVGLTAVFEFFPTPQIALGFAPGLVFGLRDDTGELAGPVTQIDARARLRFGQLDSDDLALSGYLALGGSWLSLPDDGVTSSGATVGFGINVTYPLRGRSFVVFDVGYQAGFQGTASDQVVDLSTSLLHLGFGLGSYL